MTAAASRRRPRKALSAHPLFATAVSLWFAALLGLSSLALPPALLERGVAAVGLERVLPAAAAPLGETARLLIVAALATVGEILGLLAAGAVKRRSERAHGRQARPAQMGAVRRAEQAGSAEPEPVRALDCVGEPAAEPAEVTAPLAIVAEPPLDAMGLLQLTERLGRAVQHNPSRAADRALAAELRTCRERLERDLHAAPAPFPAAAPNAPDAALKDALASLQRVAASR